jgi:hypothetical protein
MENTNLKSVLYYCEKEKLYFGEGTATARILFIGKECGWNDGMLNPDKKENIELQAQRSAEHNLNCWRNGNGCLDKLKADALQFWANSPTWGNYQKLVQQIIGKEIPKYDFLDYSFITELSQISLPNSKHLKENDLTRASIEKRKSLFEQDFFQNFPIVIMACGHYPREFDFDIEKIFGVKWVGETKVLSRGNYYNIHYGKDKILIHTRQVSSGVTNELLSEIANLCKDFFK